MANTFFGFNTALNDHADRLGSSPDDIEGLEAEEEYDALNDETFGALETEGDLDDWEVQHEQLAEIAESSRHSNDIESFLDHLGLNDEDSPSREKNVWAYTNDLKNGEKPAEKLKSSFLDSSKLLPSENDLPKPSPQHYYTGQPRMQQQQQVGAPKLQTVEELERMLLNQVKPPQNMAPQQQMAFSPRFPPGFQPLPMPPGGTGGPMWPPHHQQFPPHHHHHHHQMPPPGMVRMMGPPHGRVPPPHLMPPGPGGPPPPPGFMYPQHHNAGFPMNPHFNFPPPPRVNTMQAMHHQQNQRQNFTNNNTNKGPSHMMQRPPCPDHTYANNRGHAGGGDYRDEYCGLMNNREKQWLLNIQLLQVNTGTPYFDDYYYTVFKERQAKNKENVPEYRNNNQRYHNNRYQQHGRDGNAGHHHNRNSMQDNRQDNTQNPLNKKVYTPLQFENSLGKLQFGSVTAPRKIIDMDIINLEKDSESTNSSRDSRKTKQLLLELEALYSLILKAEDLKNPVAISNTEKLMELKQKQRLREMDAAPTPEQKQEVLKLLQQESVAPVENQTELLGRIVCALLVDEKLTSFLGIRKGKMLLLRVLPHLTPDTYSSQLLEFWIKFLLSIPLIGRRDSVGDNILPRFHPYFKRFIFVTEMDQILEIVTSLVEIIKLENSRSTPLSHQSKPPLYFILQNKFGVSAICLILQRVDCFWDNMSTKQSCDWSNFLSSLVETLSLVGPATVTAIEPITEQGLNRHAEKVEGLTLDKRQQMEKTFVDSTN